MTLALAKRELVRPDFATGPVWVRTAGPIVTDLCAGIGLVPDPQQEMCLDEIFAVDVDGHPACFAFACVVCRQNLKTVLFQMACIGFMYVLELNRVVWTAHEKSTALDSMNSLGQLIESSPALMRRMPMTRNKGLFESNGEERIESRTGHHIMFKARTNDGGRGLWGNRVILDEYFGARPSHVGSLIPTMMAQADAQVLYGSSAGKPDSDLLRDVRDRGRAGSSPRLSYREWLAPREVCVPPDCEHPKSGAVDCALDREHLHVAANPAVSTGRVTLQRIADMRQEMPPDEFMRECLGWWPDSDGEDGLFGKAWVGLGRDRVKLTQPVLGVASSFDELFTSIAGGSFDGKKSRGRLLAHGRGTAWAVDELLALQGKHNAPIVVAKRGPAAGLIPDLVEADANLIVFSADDVADAGSFMRSQVGRGRVRFEVNPVLVGSVLGSVWRSMGDRMVLARRGAADTSPVEALMLAAAGAKQELNYDIDDSIG